MDTQTLQFEPTKYTVTPARFDEEIIPPEIYQAVVRHPRLALNFPNSVVFHVSINTSAEQPKGTIGVRQSVSTYYFIIRPSDYTAATIDQCLDKLVSMLDDRYGVVPDNVNALINSALTVQQK